VEPVTVQALIVSFSVSYVQANPAIVMLVGSVFLSFALVFFIYGRIELRINA